MDQRLILLTQLIKLGVAAAIAGAWVRSRDFKRLLFAEPPSLQKKISLVMLFSIPYALGVWVRQIVGNFLAADLSFEASLLMGVLAGPIAGAIGGGLVSVPAVLHQEYLTLPFNVGVGILAGILRDLARDPEEIWSFSPFIDLSVYRWVRKMVRRPHLDWQMGFFFLIVSLQFTRMELGKHFPGRIFYLQLPPGLSFQAKFWISAAIYATTIAVIAIPLKIFNAVRLELKLREHERLLLQARMEALQSQINPHFLFNTLNSVSSLVRVDPDTARELIVKLANILRRLLRQTETFVPLREELEFVDNYLDIEVVRFGQDKLQVEKDIQPESLSAMVPSMLLQPLVENAIKHGLEPKLDGGKILLRSRLTEDRLILYIADDGIGMDKSQPPGSTRPDSTGIGMSNVAERLKVLYGDVAEMAINSEYGIGTLITLELPLIDDLAASELSPQSIQAPGSLYPARSSTLR
ncbi:MAG TPA: histidine kinase [Terriglobales bacterium]|jgi:two-component system LytT family sensor kinase|nr:histidine kinase [Terriglobales bacterium]